MNDKQGNQNSAFLESNRLYIEKYLSDILLVKDNQIKQLKEQIESLISQNGNLQNTIANLNANQGKAPEYITDMLNSLKDEKFALMEELRTVRDDLTTDIYNLQQDNKDLLVAKERETAALKTEIEKLITQNKFEKEHKAGLAGIKEKELETYQNQQNNLSNLLTTGITVFGPALANALDKWVNKGGNNSAAATPNPNSPLPPDMLSAMQNPEVQAIIAEMLKQKQPVQQQAKTNLPPDIQEKIAQMYRKNNPQQQQPPQDIPNANGEPDYDLEGI